MRSFLSLTFLLFFVVLSAQTPEVALTKGLIIKQSCRIKSQSYALTGSPADKFEMQADPAKAQPVISIIGDQITVDFQNAELRGATDPNKPDAFYGVAIRVRGRHITLKNARANGYKIALLAESADSLTLENCDFSYNYRPQLSTLSAKDDEADWLSYQQNERHEWMRHGAAVYLDYCTHAVVKGCRVTGGQNALLMVGCTDARIYNNFFQFNSRLGIGLYRSNRNRLMHNMLDWNVRGQQQESAAILIYEQSNNNMIAYNSATHSGHGFLLWAGQTTLRSGNGGCNNNLVFGNDFSHAPLSGLDLRFSRNRVQGNLITGCNYGVRGSYSYETVITGNMISNFRIGVAIERGQQDTILQNLFSDDSIGVQMWSQGEIPNEWTGYAQKHDLRSRDHSIDRNVFTNVHNPLAISASQNISVNGENLFFNFDQLLVAGQPNEKMRFLRNDIYCKSKQIETLWQHPDLTAWQGLNFSHPGQQPTDMYAPLQIRYGELHEPDSLVGGMLAVLPAEQLKGKQWIITGNWGPYDFQRPIIQAEADSLHPGAWKLQIVGPPGTWRVSNRQDVISLSAENGQVPAELRIQVKPESTSVLLELEYIGKQAVRTEPGTTIPAGQPYKFDFQGIKN